MQALFLDTFRHVFDTAGAGVSGQHSTLHRSFHLRFFMTFRRFSSSFFLFFALFVSLIPALAQERTSSRQMLLQRGDLPSRGLSRLTISLLRNQVSSPSPTPLRFASARLALPRAARPSVAPPAFDTRSAVNPAPSLVSPGAIALGAYFYQNGQCAPGDDGAVSAWKSRAGRLPAVWMIYQSWTDWNHFPTKEARRAQLLGARLLVTWEPWSGQRDAPQWNCASIASGAQDAYIRQYARAVRAAGVPVMIRFAHEMNGDWYPWGTAFEANFTRHNDNSPQSYLAMWHHVVALFRAEGAQNACWVWAPNIQFLNSFNSETDQKMDLAALYPGDDCVDWIGLSVYNDASKRDWRTFADLFDSTYRTLTQISSKPLMIAELGVTETGAPRGTSKAEWISQTLLRDIPARYPRVRLVNWFCRDKTAVGEANYRFDSSPGALQAFRVAVNSPLYGGNLGAR